MSNEILQGNAKIAEFMTPEFYQDKMVTGKMDMEFLLATQEYSTSWDWLMPVWHKFRNLNAPTGLEGVMLNYITRLAQDLAYEEIGVFFNNLVNAIDWYTLNVTPS